MIDVAVTQPHYWRHIQPVWEHLPPNLQGTIHASPIAGIEGEPLRRLKHTTGPVLVASFADLRHARNRPVILMEHGVGQSYSGDPSSAHNPSYPGGQGRRAAVFLSPNQQAADRDRRRYPRATIEIIGVPSVNRYRTIRATKPRNERPVVCVSTHWPCPVSRESGYAWGHWRQAFADLAASGEWEILGHAHPRVFDQLLPFYRQMRIEPVRSLDEIAERADVYVFDNSSSGFEMRAAGVPVVVLDAPSWRQHIRHGLRFWDAADIGPRIVDPAALPGAVRAALTIDPWPDAALAELACPPIPDPCGRAVEVITEWATLHC